MRSRFPTPEDTPASTYARLGLTAGLEIHQQLQTEKKLFCRCPAGRYSPDFDAEILRHMRPTLSELGEYDGTALMEFKTRKEIVYRLNRGSVCTYEMDDTPPFMLNDEALDIALEIAVLLRCQLVGELHIIRKQYLDGSIPTGFQRTTIVGVDGAIRVGGREVRIQQLGLEEDSCRQVSDVGHVRTFLTDRLSMPLVEVVTKPDLKTPAEVGAAATTIRQLTRATGKVRTGGGAARQDVNVSVKGGTRAEIKGVPRIALIPRLVHYEAFRQRALLDIRERLLREGLAPETFKAETRDVLAMVRGATLQPLKEMIAHGAQVRAVRLPRMRSTLTEPTAPARCAADEIADRVRVVACLDRLPNILYAPVQGFPPRLWERVRRAVNAADEDAVVLTWGEEKDAKTAAGEIEIRARELLVGIPSETRQVLRDGSTGFERILPGPDRMYPDTDLPPIEVTDGRVEDARRRAPALPWELESKYVALGVSPLLARTLSISRDRALFERTLEISGAPVCEVAVAVGQHLRGLRRREKSVDALTAERLGPLLAAMAGGRFAREALLDLMAYSARKPEATVEGALAALGIEPLDEATVPGFVSDVLKSGRNAPADEAARFRYYMGLVMAKLRGRVKGAVVAEAVRARL